MSYQQDTPVAPRFDINAPDLYIPGMTPNRIFQFMNLMSDVQFNDADAVIAYSCAVYYMHVFVLF